jgi:hypothetical protein
MEAGEGGYGARFCSQGTELCELYECRGTEFFYVLVNYPGAQS